MADDTQGASPKNGPTRVEANEDAETRAARRELKQSSISDPPPSTTASGHDTAARSKAEGRHATPAGDTSDTQNEDLRERVSSPKKKRAHDQLDGDMEAEDNDATSVASTDSAKDRASRLEPEKKRHRDEEPKDMTLNPPQADAQSALQKDEHAGKSPTKKSPDTPSSTFAASGFGKLAAGSSAFASLGASKGSAFGSSKPVLSSFASSKSPSESQPASATAVPKLTFGSNGSASPFAGISSPPNGFGSGIGGGGFGSALSGAKPLSSFGASAGKPLQSGKAAKPFGAPDSDADDGDDDNEEEAENDSQAGEAQPTISPEKDSEDKKRTRLHRVEVNDGEAGEATIVSVRAKMFSLDKEAGWKERGAGMLKINVPRACVEFDEGGAPIIGSFDASGFEVDDEAADDSKGHMVARLIMRQDQTHRVILNTPIVPAMQFQEKASLKSVVILFTAFEGEQAKPVSVSMKMTAANAKSFMNEIGMVQKELRGN